MTGDERKDAPSADPDRPGGSSNPCGSPAGESGPPAGDSPRAPLALAFGAWLCLFGLLQLVFLFVVPSFEAMFRDMGKPLPAITQFFIGFARFVRYPAGSALSALVLLASIGLLVIPWPRRLKVVIYCGLSVAAVIFLPFAVTALFLPLVVTIQSVGGK